MSSSTTSTLALLLLLSLPSLLAASSSNLEENFIQCLNLKSELIPIPISTTFFTKNHPNFTSVLNSTAMNLRYLSPSVPKPAFIFTPLHESHVQAAVICSKKLGVHLRIHSGGHDYEGVSYAATVDDHPFMVLDFQRLRSVRVDIDDETAWVESGATLGELYYRIAEKSNVHGFPAGDCPSVGVGGHVTGGGYGPLLRKYGLAVDNVIDVRLVDSEGKIVDREAMGEDHFWAIRGGGGGSFGVVVSWKVKLVSVPPKGTYFSFHKVMHKNDSKLFNAWQKIADEVDEDLFLRVMLPSFPNEKGETIRMMIFLGLFLGEATGLVRIMTKSFPELKLSLEDCQEITWIESVVVIGGFPYGTPPEILLEAKNPLRNYLKGKSDFVRDLIPESAIQGLWRRLEGGGGVIIYTPYGGMMNRVSEFATPFPHRNGTKYMIEYMSTWADGEASEAIQMEWVRNIYIFMEPYVTKDPRTSYDNYKDFDMGFNENGSETCYEQARVWGYRFFKDNFDRLVEIKSKVDPSNFFWHEQSIPPFSLCGLKYESGSVIAE